MNLARFASTLYDLAAPEARALRLATGIGVSGARITVREAEQLYARRDEQLPGVNIELLVKATKLRHHKEQLKRESKKKAVRAKRKSRSA